MSEHSESVASGPSNSLPDADGIITGTRKRKIVFALKDPNNSELQHTADQAARKKAKISETRRQPKGTKGTAPKKSQPATKAPTATQKKTPITHRASVEIVADEEDSIESDEDLETNDQPKTTAKPGASKSEKRKKGVQARNEVEDEDIEEIEVEAPAESAEAELGEHVEHFFTYYITYFRYPCRAPSA
jgi:hypothetical protein